MTTRTGSMNRWIGAVALAATWLGARSSAGAPQLRVQVEQRGDFVLIGGPFGQDCAPGTPAPIAGTVGACGTFVDDSAPDVFWRSDEPMDGQALADVAITTTQARTTAVLALPPGAAVTHAFLYWAASTKTPGNSATLSRPGVFSQGVTAIQSFVSNNTSYQSVADVTALVQANGAGPYRVSDAKLWNIVDDDGNGNFAGWWMAVLYALPADPPRSLAIFDGLDVVLEAAPQDAMLSGFVVPPVFGQAKLGVVAFEGDGTITGDKLFFDGTQLSNGENPPNNFFNGSRTHLGAAASSAGDLPQLSGAPRSMSGIDMDVIDVTSELVAGQSSVPIQVLTSGDTFHIAGFITSVPSIQPDFSTSTKTATDLNGDLTLPGDVVRYTIDVVNTGNDASIQTVLTDTIPAGATYVPGTIEITQGPGAGPRTDTAGDDTCEYDAAAAQITCRLGVGADAVQGGTFAIGAGATVTFDVVVDAGFSGSLTNQGLINSAGLLNGVAVTVAKTDGNGAAPGIPPTTTLVDLCATDANCSGATPHCDVTPTPNVCVECLLDDQCPEAEPICDPASSTCVCAPAGAEVCDGIDNDCDDQVDEGFDVGAACTAGVGACLSVGTVACDAQGASGCDAVPGAPSPEMCGDAVDSDCDGDPDNGCGGTGGGGAGGTGGIGGGMGGVGGAGGTGGASGGATGGAGGGGTGGGGTGTGGGGGEVPEGVYPMGGGCACAVPATSETGPAGAWLLVALAALWVRRSLRRGSAPVVG